MNIIIINNHHFLYHSLKGTVRSADNLPPAVIRDRHTGREILFQYVLSLPPPTTAAEKTQLPTPSISGTSQQQCIPICAGWLQKRGEITCIFADDCTQKRGHDIYDTYRGHLQDSAPAILRLGERPAQMVPRRAPGVVSSSGITEHL